MAWGRSGMDDTIAKRLSSSPIVNTLSIAPSVWSPMTCSDQSGEKTMAGWM
jgi:hypothetical protein